MKINNLLTSDMWVDYKLLGTCPLLNPFTERTSSQRLAMLATQLPQACVIYGAEQPKISTGWEYMTGQYEHSPKLKNDMQVIAVIPKFRLNMGNAQLKQNPMKTIIFRDISNNSIDYMDIYDYEQLYEGFGYRKKLTKTNYMLSEGNIISKGTKFTTSPNHDDGFYKQGVNANIAYMTNLEVAEDAFVISKSLAKACEHTAIHTTTIQIPIKATPLNNYSTDEEYKIFPDLGELVNDDGVLMAFRPNHEDTFLENLKMDNLANTQYLHDNIYQAEPGAEVIDVQVYISNRAARDKKNHTGPYSQLFKYQEQHNCYYESVLELYEKLKKDGEKFSSNFNRFIVKTLELHPPYSKVDSAKNKKLMNKNDIIHFAQVTVTYSFTRKIGLGGKLSGRHGDKGVVAAIWEDEDMPIDEHGVRADMIKCPQSIPSRLNAGQLYETAINRASYNVQQIVKHHIDNNTMDYKQAYNYVIDYFKLVRPVYAKFMSNLIGKHKLQERFIDEIIDNGIYLIIPPFCKSITEELILELEKRYDVKPSRVKYNIIHSNGTKETIYMKTPMLIGEEYLYLLCKIPRHQLSSVGAAYLSHIGLPIKPKSKSIKSQNVTNTTPIKIGEDEQSMLTQSLGAETTSRLLGLYSGSSEAFELLENALLTDTHPSRFKKVEMTDKEIVATNKNVSIFNHESALIGHQYKKCENFEWRKK